jgi:hypothetical protein
VENVREENEKRMQEEILQTVDEPSGTIYPIQFIQVGEHSAVPIRMKLRMVEFKKMTKRSPSDIIEKMMF